MRRSGGLHSSGAAGGARTPRWSAAMLLAGVLVASSAATATAADDPGSHAHGEAAQEQDRTVAPRTGLGPNGGFGGAAGFAPVPADPDVVPAPPANEDLPQQVDEKGPFAQQVSCDPVDRPGVTAFALLLSTHYGRPAFSGARPCIDYASFHHDGRALDWSLDAHDSADRQIADAVLVWLTEDEGAVAKRFGIEYVIWNGLIWDAVTAGWSHYTGNPHTDHIHFSFTWDGAQMRTSWWTGVAVTEPDLGPCDATPWQYAALHQAPRLAACDQNAVVTAPSTGLARVRPGESGPGVAMLQEELGLEPTGVLDERTREALLAWQQEHGIPATGVADEFAYAAALGWELAPVAPEALAVPRAPWQTTDFTPYLRTTLTEGDEGEAVRLLQEALGVEADGEFGPLTAEALAAWEETVPVLAAQAARRGDGPAVVTPLTWLLLERAAHPTIAVREVPLTHGSLDVQADPDGELARQATLQGRSDSPYSGGAVTFLQELLGLESDGSYGPATAAAVRQVQKAAGLEPTGEVDGATWAAVERVALEKGRVPGMPGEAEPDEKAGRAEAKAEVRAKPNPDAVAEAEEAGRRAAQLGVEAGN